MKLFDIITGNSHVGHNYLLIENVTDDDALILRTCGMSHIEDYDEMDYEGNNYEAWIQVKYAPYVEKKIE